MFSSWTVDELLGEDETTVRFRVRQLTLQRVSTLVVTRAPLGDADAEALARRLRAVSALRHPSLVELHDHGRLDDGRAFVVHACVDGDDLASEVARRGALPPHEVLELVEDICDAMALAHRAGVTDCALAPADIMLTPAGLLRQVRICGFARLHAPASSADDEARARDIAAVARLTAQLLAGDVARSDGELWAGLPAATARMLAEPLLSDRPRDITALLRQLRSALSPSTRRPTASVTAAVGLRVQLRVTSAAPDQIELLRDALAVARVACVDYDFDIAAEQPNAILALRCLDDGEDAEASRRAAARIAERINDELSPLRGEGLTAQVSVRNGRVIARKNGERVRYLGGDLMNASGWSGADKWRSPATTRVTTATRS